MSSSPPPRAASTEKRPAPPPGPDRPADSSQLKSPASAWTAERWAREYVESRDLAWKTQPPAPPEIWEEMPPVLDLRPGRPPELQVTTKKPRSFKLGALHRKEARAALHHKFWHHELQAAELMCWALLRFSDTPQEFRKGLLRICRDEVRHMRMYQDYIEGQGFSIGAFPVRDWFWDRVPTCTTPVQFVALLGLGLEGANLDHTARFAHWLRAVGDEPGAELQERVGREEVAHVRFAARWFRHWTGGVSFDAWKAALPPPLSPLLMRGKTVQRESRLKSAMPEEFVERLAAWEPEPLDAAPPAAANTKNS